MQDGGWLGRLRPRRRRLPPRPHRRLSHRPGRADQPGGPGQPLHSHGITADAQALRQSLARLQLAYVLQEGTPEYRFAIPLLQDQFEPAEVELLLHQELAVLAKTG